MNQITTSCAAVAVALLCTVPVAARTTPLRGTPPQRLLAAATKSNKTTVIVGVRVAGGWNAKNLRIPAKAAEQRGRVAEAKQQLLRKYPDATRIADRDYEHIPYFMVTLNEHTLRRMLDDDQVTSIEENSAFQRTLVQSTGIIKSAELKALGYDGTGQTIAIIDDGVAGDHAFFGNRVKEDFAACFSGWPNPPDQPGDTPATLCPNGQTTQYGVNSAEPCSLSECRHGTEVAGVAAGKHPTDPAFFGVAPGANILPIQVYSYTGSSNQHTVATRGNVLKALEYLARPDVRAAYNIAAANLSLALPDAFEQQSCINNNPSLEDAATALHALGTAVIAGAGNENTQVPKVPACLTNVISVGATLDNDVKASYSDSPPYLDFFAPGGKFVNNQVPPGEGIETSSLPLNTYVESAGTSLAAPHVAGAFAVLRDVSEQATVTMIENALKTTGVTVPGYQAKRIDVQAARAALDMTPPTAPGAFSATGNSSGGVTIGWQASTDDSGIAHYEISRRGGHTAAFAKIDEVESGTSYTDTATASKMYEYRIVAVDTYGNRSSEVKDYAVTVTFTEDPIPVPNPAQSATLTPIRGAHIAQLREAADAWREFALSATGRIYSSYAASGVILAADFVHMSTGIVSAFNGARSAMLLTSFSYSTSVGSPAPEGAIKRQHVQELRDALK